MATVITAECINCAACEAECPNTAIYQGGIEWELDGQKHAPIASDIFYIVPEKCTECVGFYDHEACAAVCPVDCCVPDPNAVESEEVLLERARELHPGTDFGRDFPSRFRKQSASVPSATPGPPSTSREEPTPEVVTTGASPSASVAAVSQPKSAPAAAPPQAAAQIPRNEQEPPAARPKVSAQVQRHAPEPPAAPTQTSAQAQRNAPEPPAAPVAAAPGFTPQALDEWEIPIVCRSCAGEYKVAFQYLKPGVVFYCPHCQGSFVPSRSTYLGISAALARFTRRWEREADELEKRRRRELEELEGCMRALTGDGVRAAGTERRRWFGLKADRQSRQFPS